MSGGTVTIAMFLQRLVLVVRRVEMDDGLLVFSCVLKIKPNTTNPRK
jgi:hypothetical protein